MKEIIVGIALLSSFSAFAQSNPPTKIYQCVLETAGVLEKSYDNNWRSLDYDIISSDKTRIAAVASLKNKCLDLGGHYYTLRLLGTNDPVIDYNENFTKMQARNLEICKKIIKENMACEIGEEVADKD